MDDLIKTFHIDWQLLIAQLVNFFIVLGVLWFFALKPITKVLRERSQKIESGIKNAEKIETDLKALEERKAEEMKKAQKEAQKIIEAALVSGDEMKKDLVEKAKKEAVEVLIKAKEGIEEAKQQMLSEVKKEIADLVVLSTERILKEKINEKKDREMIEDTIKNIKK